MSLAITCPLPTQLHTAPTVPALLDIDAPVIPANGFTLAPSGDYKLTGELATVEKILWATILTPLGALDWDPAFGSRLELKRLRPVDLAAERRRIAQLAATVPYVTRVDVQLLFEDDEVLVSLVVETNFGSFPTQRPAAGGA